MKESISMTGIFQIVILFILLFTAIMALTINNSNAFGVKDEIVNVIEINNGNFLNRNGNLSDEIVQIIEETSYRTVGNCDEGYQGYQRNGAPNDGNRAAVCLKCVPVTSGIDDYYVELLGNNVVGTNDFPNGYYIQVVVFYQLDIPVVNQVYDFKTKGETRILFGDEGGLCS
ncbi:MAG: hypothetical protein E7172_03925 [Firmicutes bacterium]|nr:hypothetical protein [Bacillota bacterium]